MRRSRRELTIVEEEEEIKLWRRRSRSRENKILEEKTRILLSQRI